MSDYTSILKKWHDRHDDRSWDDIEDWFLLAGLVLAIAIVGAAQWRFSQRDKKKPLAKIEKNPRSLPVKKTRAENPPEKRTEADAVFHGAAEEDVVFKDDHLGYLYRHRPTDADDLTAIKGIGDVFAGRLNEWGVFQYRQIALWTEHQIAEFSQRMACNDRIVRDEWVNQSRQLWEKQKG